MLTDMSTETPTTDYQRARQIELAAKNLALVDALRLMARGATIPQAASQTGLSAYLVQRVRRDNLPAAPWSHQTKYRLPEEQMPADRWRRRLPDTDIANAIYGTAYEALASEDIRRICEALRASGEVS